MGTFFGNKIKGIHLKGTLNIMRDKNNTKREQSVRGSLIFKAEISKKANVSCKTGSNLPRLFWLLFLSRFLYFSVNLYEKKKKRSVSLGNLPSRFPP